MKGVLFFIVLMIGVFSTQADIAYPEYRDKEKSLLISGTQKIPGYNFYVELDYKHHENEEFRINEDPDFTRMYYSEDFVDAELWAQDTLTGKSTVRHQFVVPVNGVHLIIKGIKDNKIRIKQGKISKSILPILISPKNNINRNFIVLIFMSALSFLSIFILYRFRREQSFR